MTKELTALSPSTMKIKVFASPVCKVPGMDWRIYLVFLRIFPVVFFFIKSAKKLVVELPTTVDLSLIVFLRLMLTLAD